MGVRGLCVVCAVWASLLGRGRCGGDAGAAVSRAVAVSWDARAAWGSSVAWEANVTRELGWDVNVTRDAMEAVSGACPSGSYCPAGSAAPTECPARSFCVAGSSAPTPCGAGLTSQGGTSACGLRVVVVNVSRLLLTRDPFGDLRARVPTSRVWFQQDRIAVESGTCGTGTYCPAGASAPTGCPARSFCVAGSSAPTPCGAGLWSAAGAGSASGCDTRWVNVTVSGAERGREWERLLPAGWGARVGVDRISPRAGVCPAGRYCPAGTQRPIACEAGAYSAGTGERNASACAPCEAGHYCPDPGQRYRCPNYTASEPGSASQVGCKCRKGAVCLYTRQLQVSVVVPVPLGQWLSDAGLRGSVVEAVAASAGVDKGRVWLYQAKPVAEDTGTRRRLLEVRGTPASYTLVRAAVRDGEAFHRLEERLEMAHPRLRGARAQWTPGSRVRVLGGAGFLKGAAYI